MHSTLKTFIDVQGPKFSLTDINEDVKESSFNPNYEEIPSIPGQMLAWYQDRKLTAILMDILFILQISEITPRCF